MGKLFYLDALTEARKDELRNTGDGCYTYDLRSANAETVDRMSRGFSAEATRILAGRIVILGTFPEDGNLRAFPIPEQFTEAEARAVALGSFRLSALGSSYSCLYNNSLLSKTAICLECGKTFTARPASHTCGEVSCSFCGRAITTAEEKGAHMCLDCATRQAYKIHGYHNRPNRGNPIFSRPEKRDVLQHIGGEIEVDGGNGYLDEGDTKVFSSILNTNPFRPFIEFERDGSLNGGVECITAPTTWDDFKKKGKAIAEFYREANARTGGKGFLNKNGLHFHLDARFFDDGTSEGVAKARILIEYMVYKYFDFFQAISGRKSGAFGYAKKKIGVDGIASASMNATDRDRYYAVNTTGSRTIELRFFGGKINSCEGFFACLDFAQAIGRWAKATDFAVASKHTPLALVRYLKNKENTLYYLNHLRADRVRTEEGERILNAFKTELEKAMEREEEARARRGANA